MRKKRNPKKKYKGHNRPQPKEKAIVLLSEDKNSSKVNIL
tara:strand:- start:290 stop:409 length:120 start_codon:yes stop_codon:yes gene_type:complete